MKDPYGNTYQEAFKDVMDDLTRMFERYEMIPKEGKK